jgi:hypothetical protein
MKLDSLIAQVERSFRAVLSPPAVEPRAGRRTAAVQGIQRRRRLRKGRVLTAAFVALIGMSFVTMHAAEAIHEGGKREVAERLTRAIEQRDTIAMRELFAPGVGEEVVRDIRLGAMADRFNTLGPLREVRVQHGASGGSAWTMVASFMHGTQIEHLRFQGDRVAFFMASPAETVTDTIAAQ